MIVRRLTITGTHKHGLPTAMDDEVMVGLIQLTKRRNNFTDAKVSFSRYELIELLGWPQSGQSYRRIEEALHRWVGVVLMYENAWWDNTAKSWVDENFHVLDNVTVYDRERRGPAKGKPGRRGSKGAAGAEPLPLSSFRWNEVIFRSFQSGNLKQLDLEFYLSLRLPTTKRLFRFLDKRFYRCDRLDFDLKTFACEHIGMSRTYKPTELKRRLKPGARGTGVARLSGTVARRGALFLAGARPVADPVHPRRPGPRGRVGRGAHGRAFRAHRAAHRARGDAEGRRRTGGFSRADPGADQDRGLRLARANEDRRVGKNPAGYLVASIRSDYQAPPGFSAADPDGAKEVEIRIFQSHRRREGRGRPQASRSRAGRRRDLPPRFACKPTGTPFPTPTATPSPPASRPTTPASAAGSPCSCPYVSTNSAASSRPARPPPPLRRNHKRPCSRRMRRRRRRSGERGTPDGSRIGWRFRDNKGPLPP